MISIDELRYLVQVRQRWDTRVTLTHHGDGTGHILSRLNLTMR